MSLASYGYQLVNDTTPGERLPHRYGNVTSLGKAYCYKEVQKSLRDYIWASPKMDGMSVAMYYQAGCLVTALTRGDYVSGIDITKKGDSYRWGLQFEICLLVEFVVKLS